MDFFIGIVCGAIGVWLVALARLGLRHHRWNLRYEGAYLALERKHQGERPNAAEIAELLEQRERRGKP